MEEGRFRLMIDSAKAGEKAAADCLFVECYQTLRNFAVGLMDNAFLAARMEPEDILQEAYVAAWPKIPDAQFDNFAAFVGWLKTIVKNKVTDLRRGLLAKKHDVRREVGNPAGESTSYMNLVDRLGSPKSTPSKGVARREALAILTGQVWQLPEDYRQVIQWRFIQGLPVAEVAERLNRSEPAVHMLCHRALRKLKELMGSPSKYLSSA